MAMIFYWQLQMSLVQSILQIASCSIAAVKLIKYARI